MEKESGTAEKRGNKGKIPKAKEPRTLAEDSMPRFLAPR